MKNVTTRYFCRKFKACYEGTKFALKFERMRECYNALLNGEAGAISMEWAIWAATREGVMFDQALRLFAVKCARSVQQLMKDERSVAALDVAERYAKGEATKEELKAAKKAAWDAVLANVRGYAVAAATEAAWAAATGFALYTATTTRAAAWDAEHNNQLEILKEFGNPFEEN